MKRMLECSLLLLLAGSGSAQSNPDLVVLSKGTEIRLVMAETLTSKHAYRGQRVELQVADDVSVGGAILVPKGTRVLGTVTAGEKEEGKRNNPGTVAIQVDYVRLGDRRILLTGAYSDKGKVDKGAVVAGAVLFGVSGVLLAMDARTGEIKEGTEVKGIVAEDVALPSLGRSSKPEEKQPSPAIR